MGVFLLVVKKLSSHIGFYRGSQNSVTTVGKLYIRRSYATFICPSPIPEGFSVAATTFTALYLLVHFGLLCICNHTAETLNLIFVANTEAAIMVAYQLSINL